jgi:hypothetical protein
VRAVTTVFLVDSEGVVRYKQSVPPDDLAQRVRQLSSGPRSDAAAPPGPVSPAHRRQN